MPTSQLAVLVVVDLLIVLVVSIGFGAWAPRWPDRWLQRDAGPLRLTGFDTPAAYRRLRVARWARRLPELGAAFGGASKRALPGWDADELAAYATEARRGEWVHWLSMASIVPIALISPWWLAVAFAAVILIVNAAFIAILRYNRVRLAGVLRRLDRAA